MQNLTARYIFAITTSSVPATFTIKREGLTLNDVLEYKKSANLKKLIILPWASDIQWTSSPSVVVTYTKTGVVTERSGNRYREVQLSGDVGPMPQRWPGEVEDVVASVAAVEELNAWLQVVAENPNYVMTLYALNEGLNWIVVPSSGMNISRSRGNRTGLHYDLKLRMLTDATAPVIDMLYWLAPSAQETVAKRNTLDQAKKALKWWEKIRNFITNAKKWAKRAIKYVDRYINGALTIGNELMNLVSDLEQWVAGIIHRPAQWWQQIQRIAGKCKVFANACKRDFYEYFTKGSPFGPLFPAAGNDIRPTSDVSDLLEMVDSALDAVNKTALALCVDLQNESTKYGYISVRQGDTLESLAIRIYGEPIGVDELIVLNDLRYPFISTAGIPGTVRPGQKLKVRTRESANSSATITAPTVTDPDEVLLGADFAFLDGDLAMEAGSFTTGEQADIEMVRGEDNFAQNLDIRVRTLLGTNLVFPQSGLPVSIGLGNTRERMADFATAALREMRSDDRVFAVSGFKVNTVGNAVGFEATLNLRSGQQVSAVGVV